MRAMTGRAVSAAIHQRLKDALARGEPLTYQQLADQAGCTVRSVRNYLDRAHDIFGFAVHRSRDDQHRIVVSAVNPPRTAAPAREPNDPFGPVLSRALFPDRNHPEPEPLGVIVAFRGMPAYGPHQAAAARAWAEAARARPPRALRVRRHLPPKSSLLWPIAVVVHNLEGVVLIGALGEPPNPPAVLSLDLASIPDEPDAVIPAADATPHAIDLANHATLDALPFTAHPPDPAVPMVDVHVRFEPSLASRLAPCVWHPSQHVATRKSGELEVRFGPVPLHLAASWVAHFGSGIHVQGDKKLRKAVKKIAFTL